jgi:hypothetical protein
LLTIKLYYKDAFWMIKTMSAYTFEIDDVALAVSERLAQLDVEQSLGGAHSMGLMTLL